jgi:hypothetical protein
MPLQYVKKNDPIKASWANDVIASINGTTHELRRSKAIMGGGGNTESMPCPFGELVTIPQESGPAHKGIRGGVIYCGDKNLAADDLNINGFATGTRKLYIEIPVEVNMDDDSELLLPGVKTSSKSSIATGDWKTTTDNYPDNDNPTIPGGTGTIIIPIGIVTKSESGSFTFIPNSCGDVTVNHCAGTLSFTRGYSS